MANETIPIGPVVTAVHTLLDAELSWPVGDGEAPTDPTLPYLVVEPAGDSERVGSAVAPADAVVYSVRLRAVGSRRDQAAGLLDAARAVVFDPANTISTADAKVIGREPGLDAAPFREGIAWNAIGEVDLLVVGA